uniref:Uncharacterized protein n=1 Tax=Acrobeloides nanus TaxID=290746 RepID=A0A914CF03_9BILA
MHYDPNTLAQIQAAQQLQQHQIAAMLQAQAQAGQSAVAQFGDYSQADVSAGALHQRRFLSQSREHPYANGKSQAN